MADRDDDKKFPNPEFLKTRTLGSRHLADIDYEDEVPTGVDHRSERPPPAGAPPKADPNDVYYLTDRPPRAKLPSFTDTALGPGSLETPRSDLPPVVPSPRPPQERRIESTARSPLAHSPMPPGLQAPTSDLPPVHAPPDFSPSLPMPLVSRSVRPKARGRKRKHVWKAVVPPPRFPPSEPLARVIPPGPQALLPGPKPVEDRLLNALGVLFVGVVVAFLAGWSFLIVTNTRTAALSEFITEPNHPLPSFGSAAPSASREP
jgi:hypothetical protein